MTKYIPISRRTHLLILFISIIVGWGAFCIYREYQTLPQYIMPAMGEMQIPKAGQTVLVFAPHCDDESIATGAYIKKALDAKANVLVVLSTNGDGHYVGTVEEFGKIYPKSSNYIQSGYTRQNETKSALAGLGLNENNIIFLGYPDQGTKPMLTKYWNKPYKSPYTNETRSPYNNSYHLNQEYTGSNMENDISQIINNFKPHIVVVSSPDDRHPDHAALYQYVLRAIEKKGIKPDIYTYLVHFRYFPNPNGLQKDEYLTPPLKLIGFDGVWQKLTMDSDLENLKQITLEKYQSQIKVPFLHKLMVGFVRKNELFLKVRY